MPNFEALNNISHKSIRDVRRVEKIQSANETKKSNTLAFLRRKFPGKDICGFMIGSVSRAHYTNSASWKMIAYFFTVNNIKPVAQFAGYNLYNTTTMTDPCKKLLVTLTGDSAYLGANVLFFCRR